jgi:hypothetical protein
MFSIQALDQQSTKMMGLGRVTAGVGRASVEWGAKVKRMVVCR